MSTQRASPPASLSRCAWTLDARPLDIAYHDEEWGVPVHDDVKLFEFLILEGAQAGLSWSTVLAKREHYRRAFSEFEPRRVARFDARRRARLMTNAGIVRNRLKIESAVDNAKAFLSVQEEFGSFNAYLWRFVDGRPVQNRFRRSDEVPALTKLSDTISKDLKRRGFRFVGSTIIYAYLQAVGVVNDHLLSCFRHAEVAAMR